MFYPAQSNLGCRPSIVNQLYDEAFNDRGESNESNPCGASTPNKTKW